MTVRQGPDPDIFGKWDFIRFFMDDPCDAPWTAYGLAMGGAAIEAFVSLYAIDVSQIWWSALRRGSGIMRQRSQRKGMKGSKAGRGPGRSKGQAALQYDPNDDLGKRLGRFSPLFGRPVPGPLGVLWIVFNVIETVNFWMFFAEVVTQFMYRWTSLLYNSQYCLARDASIIMRTGPNYVHGAIFGELPMQVPEVLKQRGVVTSVLSTFTIPDGYTGVAVGISNFESLNPGQPCSIIYRLHRFDSSEVFEPYEFTAPAGMPVATGAAWQLDAGGTYSITETITFGFGLVKDPVFLVQIVETGRVPPL